MRIRSPLISETEYKPRLLVNDLLRSRHTVGCIHRQSDQFVPLPIPGLRTFPAISTSGGIGLLPCTREDINENYIPVTNFAPHRNGTTGEMLMDVIAIY